MMNRNTFPKSGRPTRERGAALIVAIAIMTILLAIALTFYSISRQEVKNADSVQNRIQADLLVDSALAKAMVEINRNFLEHPESTSFDHRQFAFFDGRWVAGKPWALLGGIPLQQGGIPYINLANMPFIDFGGGIQEQLYNGPNSTPWLYYPRYEDLGPMAYANVRDVSTGLPYDYIFNILDPNRGPFVTPAYYGPSDFNGDGLYDEPVPGAPTDVLDESLRYPLEWIDTWTDEDLDLDGLRDSMWIPIGEDRFASGGEIIGEDIALQQLRLYDDRIDNDLDGMVDENQENNIDDDNGIGGYADGVADDLDESLELPTFVYYGGNDGLDNDGNGLIDGADPNEQPIGPFYGYFLTAPLPGIKIAIDLNADGIVPDLVPDDANFGILTPLSVTLPAQIRVFASDNPENIAAGTVIGISLNASRVDVIDNDWDMLANNYSAYAYVGPNTANGPPFRLMGFEDTGVQSPANDGTTIVRAIENQTDENSAAVTATVPQPNYYDNWQLAGNWHPGDGAVPVPPDAERFEIALRKSYDDINLDATIFSIPGNVLTIEPASSTFYSEYDGPGITFNYQAALPSILRITHSGEAVCNLVGRAAVLVRDEAGGLNMNVAGGHHHEPFSDPNLTAPRRSLGNGRTTNELETRVLPHYGVTRALNSWTALTGGGGAPGNNYNADVNLPGYGGVDDNANLLLAALDGQDNDGDGLVDEGLYLPPLNDPLFGVYYALLGDFEGTDDFSEMQRYRSLRNLEAEGNNRYLLVGTADTGDNDGDNAANEVGEFGDLQLKDTLELSGIIGSGQYNDLQQAMTAYSTDRNVNFVVGENGAIRAVNKLDYNLASAPQIAANLLIANSVQTVTTAPLTTALTVNRFAEGLLQGDVHIRSSFDPAAPLLNSPGEGLMWVDDGFGTLIPSVGGIPADPVLQIMQSAVDIVDFRDKDNGRSLLSTERRDRVAQTAALSDAVYDTWPTRLSSREQIREGELLPVEEIQDHLLHTMDISRKLEFRDDWWTFDAVQPGVAGVVGVDSNPEVRQISYTASGNEAIRINELMVRPVRRIEAEALPNPAILVPNLDDPVGLLPAINQKNFDPQGGHAELPYFDVERLLQGPGAWILGTTAAVPGYLGDRTWIQTSTPDSIINFRIGATDAMPPGRYYLTVNLVDPATLGVLGITAANAADLQYSISYGAPAVDPASFRSPPVLHHSEQVPGAPFGSVFLDGTDGLNPAADDYYSDGGIYDGVSDTRLGTPSSAAFPQTFTVTVSASEDLYIAFRLDPTLPPPPGPPVPTTLAIDSLDFSQEPDHEWVELVNVSNDAVDIGGWELEVGIPDRGDDVPPDPFKSKWKVPQGTLVAPQGMVLLAFNKYDHYRRSVDPALQAGLIYEPGNAIAHNGMGLAASDNAFLSYTNTITDQPITVPPIGDDSPNYISPHPMTFYGDFTGSVFRRNYDPFRDRFEDYVDRDGDGASSMYDTTLGRDTDNVLTEASILSTTDGLDSVALGETNLSRANRPWDRIVQMDNLRLTSENPFSTAPFAFTMDDVIDVDTVAALVLRGGVLPNYPERDGIDNDGDGAYVVFGADDDGDLIPDPRYIAGTLDRDMVDNDFDGLIDERGETVPGGPATFDDIDPFGIAAGFNGDGVNPQLSEGVDEGFGVPAGYYTDQLLPIQFYSDRNSYPTDIDYFNFNELSVPVPLALYPAANGTITAIDATLLAVTALDPALNDNAYLGSNFDPPDWKAFAERRWYPGDNVIVTLYQGDANDEIVADRVTYREYDVTNRTIDDLEQFPVDLGAGNVPLTINSGYPTFWPENQMGLDFYRSLERKHPLYNGDRFGTENRWQATDGNYDDWADSLSFFEAELETTATLPILVANNSLVDRRVRFPVLPLALSQRQRRLYLHAMAATPLRMNTATRFSENPRDLERVVAGAPDNRQFFEAAPWFRTHEDGPVGGDLNTQRDQSWNTAKGFVANKKFATPGDLMNVPHQTYLHDAVNTALAGGSVYLRDMTMMNYGLQSNTAANDGQSSRQDIALRGSTLGQDAITNRTFGNLLTAATNSMSLDTATFTVGQAEFHPIVPDLSDTTTFPVGAHAAILDWVKNPFSTGGAYLAPATWAPVFLFPLANTAWDTTTVVDRFPSYPSYINGVTINQQLTPDYLFNWRYLGTNQFDAYMRANAVDPYANRWPMEQRVAMYVSEVRPEFPAPVTASTNVNRPEGLFIWDGADGLENGEYVLYVGTFVPGMRERLLDAADVSANSATYDPTLPVKAETNLLYDVAPVINEGSLAINEVTREIIFNDPSHPDRAGSVFNPIFALDVITDPTEARGVAPVASGTADPSVKPPGLINPVDWTPSIIYKADDDGYIFYGNNAVGGWKPQIVRVTDNFLALRVRNMGELGDVGVITHIVLAPRKRTAGRINVNTTLSRMPTLGANHSYLNPLLSLPGVVDAATSVVPSDNVDTNLIPTGVSLLPSYGTADAIDEMSAPPSLGGRWPAPDSFYSALTYTEPGYGPLSVPPARNEHSIDPPSTSLDEATNDTHLLVPASLTDGDPGDNGEEMHRLGAFRLNQLLEIGRIEHADGRYYRSTGDLVDDDSSYVYNYFNNLSPRWRPTPPDGVVANAGDVGGTDNRAVYPLSNEAAPSKRFDEDQARFRRIGNLITTRSDVYKIFMTVESGFGQDKNGDGFINYRDPREFTTTARTKASAIYERRAPSDQTDTGE